MSARRSQGWLGSLLERAGLASTPPAPPEAEAVDHEAALAEAERAREAAELLVHDARATYDRTGAAEDLERLLELEQVRRAAEERRDRALRLLDVAREREAERRRAELEAERDRLLAAVSLEAVRAQLDPIVREEALALIRVAEIRARRLELAREHERTLSQLRAVLRELGEEPPDGMHRDERGRWRTGTRIPSHAGLYAASTLTLEALAALERELDAVVRQLLQHLRPKPSDYLTGVQM